VSVRRTVVGAFVAATIVACTSFAEPAGVDAGGTGDGGTGGDGSDAGPTCAPQPSGCMQAVALHAFDFTASAFPPSEFAPEAENGQVARADDGSTCSGGGSLRASTTVPKDVDGAADAVIMRRLQGTFSTGRLAFAFRGPVPIEQGYANIGCALTLRPAATANVRTATRLALTDHRLVLGGSARDSADAPIPGIEEIELDSFVSPAEADLWHTLDMKLTLAGSKLTVSATFDGNALAPYDLPVIEAVGRIEISCGVLYSDGQNMKYEVDIDVVLIELCP
jgi:hypothetical protein